MKTPSARKLKTWADREARQASGMARLPANNADEACMESRIVHANYRMAEAILQSGGEPKDFIQEVRTKIGRGFLREAQTMILNLLAEGEETFDRPIVYDAYTELARIHFQNADYENCVSAVNHVLYDAEVAGIVRLTFLQIRSAAWFELGAWEKCLADVETIRSLELLYPKAQSSFYSEVLAVKAIARKMGASQAESAFQLLCERYLHTDPRRNADTLLTLLRLRIDLDRSQRKPISNFAHACYLLCEAMGDRAYSALAILDLAFGENQTFRNEALSRLSGLRRSFRKVDHLLLEVESGIPVSTTARLLAEAPSPNLSASSGSLDLERNISLIFVHSGIMMSLPQLTTSEVLLQNRSRDLLIALANGTIQKDKLFREVWKIEYRSERHDVILRNSLLRLRKQSGLEIHSDMGSVTLKGARVVLL